jgi:hypothetical protein
MIPSSGPRKFMASSTTLESGKTRRFAYQRYLDEWVTGRGTPAGVTIANLLDAFLDDKHARYQTGDMTQGF